VSIWFHNSPEEVNKLQVENHDRK